MFVRITKGFTVIKNNWKKSVFFSSLICYGAYKYSLWRKENELRRMICREIKSYGEQPFDPLDDRNPFRVTVLLNPAAGNFRARRLYEKNLAPLLLLAGFAVRVLEPENAVQLAEFAEVLEANAQDRPHAVVVAGGGGSIARVLTALLSRPDGEQFIRSVPIAICPLGTENNIVRRIFGDDNRPSLRTCREIVLAMVNQQTRSLPALEISDPQTDRRFYVLSSVRWGRVIDTEMKITKNWVLVLDALKLGYQYVKSVVYPASAPVCSGELSFVEACPGCSACTRKPLFIDQSAASKGSSAANGGSGAGGGGLFAALNRSLGMARQKPSRESFAPSPPPGHVGCARQSQASSPPLTVHVDDLLALAPSHLELGSAAAGQKARGMVLKFIERDVGDSTAAPIGYMFDKRIRKPLAEQSATYQSGALLPDGSRSFEKLVSEFSLQIDTQNAEPSRGVFALDGELELARSVRVRLLADAVRVFAPPYATPVAVAISPSTPSLPSPLTQG